nr:ABC-2 family transporter protein [uncultured Cupriavidus sp.]
MALRELLRPYLAAFRARFMQMLQYRVSAYTGFATQCWWGGVRVMVLAAFYGNVTAASAPMSRGHAITYIWLAQGLLALLPWMADPEVAQAVRSGAVAYDRLRPVNGYALWFARSAGWTAARALPRAALMLAFAGIGLPFAGLNDWAWQPPASVMAGVGSLVAVVLALLLSTTLVMLLTVAAVAASNERGINTLAGPIVIVLSGNLLPLPLLPDTWQALLLVQPLAGVVDIPARIYFSQLDGAKMLAALGLQCSWIVLLIALGHAAMNRTMRGLEVQGG